MIQKIHMIAICGTGMGSLAGLFREKGYEVTGSDANVYPPMSDQLAALGIPVQSGYRSENIPQNPPPDLVIIGNAVSRNNPEVEEVLARKIPFYSMPEAVDKLFLVNRRSIVVAGTHGKTTTCGLLAWILDQIGRSPGFLVGGILKNFGKSFQLGKGNCFVIEGDEYDSAFFDKGPKFLHYRPEILILNAVEFDHADIYKNLDHLMEAFSKLVAGMSVNGLIVADGDHPNVRKLIANAPCKVVTFGLGEKVDFRGVRPEFGEKSRFILAHEGKEIGPVVSPLIGCHNVKNLLGVLGVLFELGIPLEEINGALAEFQGVKRRQEILALCRGMTLIDDFAHHPTAVRETLLALRLKYGRRKLWGIFEPRSNTTRRNVFQKDFVSAFDEADEIVVAPPYLAEKIPPEERLDPELLVEELKNHGKKARYLSVDEIVETIAREGNSGDIICFMSNGSFGGIYKKTIQTLGAT